MANHCSLLLGINDTSYGLTKFELYLKSTLFTYIKSHQLNSSYVNSQIHLLETSQETETFKWRKRKAWLSAFSNKAPTSLGTHRWAAATCGQQSTPKYLFPAKVSLGVFSGKKEEIKWNPHLLNIAMNKKSLPFFFLALYNSTMETFASALRKDSLLASNSVRHGATKDLKGERLTGFLALKAPSTRLKHLGGKDWPPKPKSMPDSKIFAFRAQKLEYSPFFKLKVCSPFFN